LQPSISVSQLALSSPRPILIDVRKQSARLASGFTIAGAVQRPPFAAESWRAEFKGQSVVVFCVHGHEVSRGVAGFLRDGGIDARILAGGFAAWCAAGKPVEPIGGTS